MSDIRITPGSSIMSFTSSLNYVETLKQDTSGSLNLYGSGSLGRTEIFSIDGNNGRLFTVTDDLSDSLFSVNTIAGLPVIEAFANNTVVMGQYGTNALVVSGSKVFIGDPTLITSETFQVNGSGYFSSNINVGGGLTINGSLNSGGSNFAGYRQGGDNIILKGNSTGVSGIFFQSEKDGTNINHPTDYGYIQFHSYGIDGTTGESNRLVIGVANDTDDMVILQSPNINGVKISYLNSSSGTGGTAHTVWHQGNHGEGSGLDADLLDGKHATDFLNTSSWDVASLSYSGSTLTLTINGIPKTTTINAGTNYTLPTASATVLGGVKIGSGISIDGNGVISANTFTPGTANKLAKFSGSRLADSIIYDNGASVGIGTTTPSPGYKLDVNGNIKFNGYIRSGSYPPSGTSGGLLDISAVNYEPGYFFFYGVNDTDIDSFGAVLASFDPEEGIYLLSRSLNGSIFSALDLNHDSAYLSASERVILQGSSYISFATAGSERFRITTTGDVGIGTSIPNAKLEVNGSVKATGFKTPSGTSTQFLMADGSTNSDTYALSSSLSNYVTLNTTQTINSSKTFVGNTFLQSRLAVIDSTGSDFFVVNANSYRGVLKNPDNGNEATLFVWNKTSIHGNNRLAFQLPTSDARLRIRTFYDQYTDSALAVLGNSYLQTITSDRITVGRSLPTTGGKLEVTSQAGSIENTYFTTSDFTLGTTGSAFNIQFGAASGNTYTSLRALKTGAGEWSDLVLQGGGGNVGIGTTPSSSYKLHVDGSILASSFFESSLRKYKTNIKKFDKSGIDLVDILEIVTFDRIDSDVKSKIGIIADDTPEEFLSEDKCAVDLYKTVFIQAKAIQELKAEIDKLKKINSNARV